MISFPVINDVHKEILLQGWLEEDLESVKSAKTFADLFVVALRVLNRMEQPIIELCGPVSNGGRGSRNANIEYFEESTVRLIQSGKIIFNIVPFENKIEEIWLAEEAAGKTPTLFEDFYFPIFESGFIAEGYFLPDWETSAGAKKEHDKLAELNIPLTHLSPDWDNQPA